MFCISLQQAFIFPFSFRVFISAVQERCDSSGKESTASGFFVLMVMEVWFVPLLTHPSFTKTRNSLKTIVSGQPPHAFGNQRACCLIEKGFFMAVFTSV